jgi:FMN-dependent NADH-azoreductase
MNNSLVLNGSVLGEQSVSRLLVDEAVHRLLEGNPGATVER